MLQSVTHIIASRLLEIGPIFVTIVLFDQGHQMQSFDPSFTEFGLESIILRVHLVIFWHNLAKFQ